MDSTKIELSNGQCAVVDKEDLDIIKHYSWYAKKKGRNIVAECSVGKNRIYLHRLIMRPDIGMVVDHINGDGLDNRKVNLRVCTRGQNVCNRTRMQLTNKSGVRGVFWEKSCNRWRAQISVKNKKKHIGVFENINEAILARDAAARKYYGAFAPVGGGL